MTQLSSTPKEKHARRASVPNFGRSAVTGQFVLKPVAVKGSRITQQQANSAVKNAVVKTFNIEKK